MLKTESELYAIASAGFSATLDAFALDEHASEVWFISMIGSQTALRAISSSLLKQPPGVAHICEGADGTPMGLNSHQCRIPPSTVGSWTTKTTKLPSSGAYHNLTYTKFAQFNNNTNGFLLLSPDEDQAPALHHKFLDKRTALPIHHSWATWLWTRGLAEGEIVKLESAGIHAYKCQPDQDSLRIHLSNHIKYGNLTLEEGETQ